MKTSNYKNIVQLLILFLSLSRETHMIFYHFVILKVFKFEVLYKEPPSPSHHQYKTLEN